MAIGFRFYRAEKPSLTNQARSCSLHLTEIEAKEKFGIAVWSNNGILDNLLVKGSRV